MSGPRVLVIDNNASTCMFIATALQQVGYMVDVALNGRDGLAKVAKLRPQCLIVDVFLQDRSGYAICRQVRQRFSREALSIILTSSHEAPLDVIYGMRQGADLYLPKPLTEEVIIKAVWEMLPGPWRSTPLQPRGGAVSPNTPTPPGITVVSDSAAHRAVPALAKLIPRRLFDEGAMRGRSPFASVPTIRDEEARQLYESIDGKRTVSEIATMTGLDAKETSRAVVMLLKNKLIQMYNADGVAVERDMVLSGL
ncbi:MAG TPA: response regulator [Ktedonosporobacter sp.]|nr:response regulator [Ktedonosporobacter sp.]